MTRFFETRTETLKVWADFTGREIADAYSELATDNFIGAYECKWQNKYEPGHVNLFCSLGDWACNITDLLKDNRFDRFYFEDEAERTVLFRHYTRIMLVVSELLTDFQDIYLQSEELKWNRGNCDIARKFYFPNDNPDTITKILNYINSVCKHKTQHIHLCNNHCEIHFCDKGNIPEGFNHISIGDPSTGKDKNAILVPELDFFINSVTNCYVKLDDYFINNEPKFQRLCKTFEA